MLRRTLGKKSRNIGSPKHVRSPRFFVMQVVVIILATSATNTSNGPAKRQALGDRTNTVGVKRARPAEFVSNLHFHSWGLVHLTDLVLCAGYL